ncbi:hypothetical protein IIA79_06500, partial [bacterium]|nr:hypothetical protein [bacterium]
MHVIYTGKLVKLRPFKDVDEWLRIQNSQEASFNEHWGPWHWPEQEKRKDFEETG